MQISTAGVNISGTDYTWQQSLRFFIIGALWAAGASLPPVAWTFYHNYKHHSGMVDWEFLRGLVASSVGPPLLLYWQKHKALLKMPPWLTVPPEFHPEIRSTTTEEHGPHSTEIVGTSDGTVIEKRSEHETKVTTETVVDIKPNEPIKDGPKTGEKGNG